MGARTCRHRRSTSQMEARNKKHKTILPGQPASRETQQLPTYVFRIIYTTRQCRQHSNRFASTVTSPKRVNATVSPEWNACVPCCCWWWRIALKGNSRYHQPLDRLDHPAVMRYLARFGFGFQSILRNCLVASVWLQQTNCLFKEKSRNEIL